MYPGDARSKWSPSFIADPRVVHLWDEQRVVGRVFLSRLPGWAARRAPDTMEPVDDAVWDAFFVYVPGDGWQDAPRQPRFWG